MPFALSGNINQNNRKRFQQPFGVSRPQTGEVAADHLGIDTQPANVVRGVVFSASPVVQALRPDNSVATTYGGDITAALSAGTAGVRTVAVFTSANSEALIGTDDVKMEFGGVHAYWASWVRMTTDATCSIASKRKNTDNLEFNLLAVASTGFRLTVSSDGTTGVGVTSASFSTATWYFVEAWHVNGVEIAIRVNRGSVARTSHTTGIYSTAPTAKFSIGGSVEGTTQYMNGRIANVYMATSETITFSNTTAGASAPDETISADLYHGGFVPFVTELDTTTINAAKRTGGTNGELLFMLDEASGTRANVAGTISLTDKNTVTSASSGETITVSNVGLTGATEAAVAGESVFDALRVDRPVTNAELTFSSGALTNVTSDTFQVS